MYSQFFVKSNTYGKCAFLILSCTAELSWLNVSIYNVDVYTWGSDLYWRRKKNVTYLILKEMSHIGQMNHGLKEFVSLYTEAKGDDTRFRC